MNECETVKERSPGGLGRMCGRCIRGLAIRPAVPEREPRQSDDLFSHAPLIGPSSLRTLSANLVAFCPSPTSFKSRKYPMTLGLQQSPQPKSSPTPRQPFSDAPCLRGLAQRDDEMEEDIIATPVRCGTRRTTHACKGGPSSRSRMS